MYVSFVKEMCRILRIKELNVDQFYFNFDTAYLRLLSRLFSVANLKSFPANVAGCNHCASPPVGPYG